MAMNNDSTTNIPNNIKCDNKGVPENYLSHCLPEKCFQNIHTRKYNRSINKSCLRTFFY